MVEDRRWYYTDSWSWASTWGGGALKPTQVYSSVDYWTPYQYTDAYSLLTSRLWRNTNRSFVWNGRSWVPDQFWAGDMPKSLASDSLEQPSTLPPSPPVGQQSVGGSNWWPVVILLVGGAIFWDVTHGAHWTKGKL